MARNKKSPLAGTENFKNKNNWAMKRMPKGFANFGISLELVDYRYDEEGTAPNRESVFVATYTSPQFDDWFIEVEFVPQIDGEYLLNFCFRYGNYNYADKYSDTSSVMYYTSTALVDEDGCDADILDFILYIIDEPELAWYQAFYELDFNSHYVSRREAKKAYKKYMKAYKKNKDSILNEVDFRDGEEDVVSN